MFSLSPLGSCVHEWLLCFVQHKPNYKPSCPLDFHKERNIGTASLEAFLRVVACSEESGIWRRWRNNARPLKWNTGHHLVLKCQWLEAFPQSTSPTPLFCLHFWSPCSPSALRNKNQNQTQISLTASCLKAYHLILLWSILLSFMLPIPSSHSHGFSRYFPSDRSLPKMNPMLTIQIVMFSLYCIC